MSDSDENWIKRKIESFAFVFDGLSDPRVTVGVSGVVEIRPILKGGLHCNIHYVEVYNEAGLVSQHNIHVLEGVYFKQDKTP